MGIISPSDTTQINVYLDDGRVFSYVVNSPASAREHADAIVKNGYRSTSDGDMEVFPPHRILKVKCVGGMSTSYPDTVRGT